MALPAASSFAVRETVVVVVVTGAGVVAAVVGAGVGLALPAASTIAVSVAKQMSFENIIIIIFLFESTCFD